MDQHLFDCIEPDQNEYADYSSRFESYNNERSVWNIETFSMVLRENNTIVAGGRGYVYLGALELRGLWVNEELRQKGIGSALLTAIETEAVNRKATKAMLFTYSWQAEKFYRAQGYTEFGRFDFPDGHYRIDMQKQL